MNYPAARLPHSGLGIASTVIAIFGGLCLLATFGYIYSLVVDTGGQMPSEQDPRTMAMGLGMICSGAMLFMSGLLGLAGLFVGERRRLFSWLGLVLTALPVLLLVIVLVLGFMAKT